MSPNDLVSAYSEYTQLVFVLQGLLITVTSAYLVAIFLGAEKLGWGQFSVLSLMYAWISFDLTLGVYYHFAAAISLHGELLRLTQVSDSQIAFLNIIGPASRSAEIPALMWAFAIATSVIFSGYHKFKARV